MALPPTDELLIQVSPDDSKQLDDIRKSFKAYKQQYEDIPQAENYTLNSATYRSPHMVAVPSIRSTDSLIFFPSPGS